MWPTAAQMRPRHRDLLRLAQAGQRFVPDRQRPACQGERQQVRGMRRPGPGQWMPDGRPEHLRRACDGSLARLRLDRIDLYKFHRPGPKVTIVRLG